ncbi:phage Gp37/Gp68 family protein [Candidatus Bathyarchaeota archaeon]|nr:phage Gp37/Gp68 family protein [Candidatus Bathyarchaeota archaeon]
MGKVTKIPWAEGTWNPWYGCHKVSAGCLHCYAERDMKAYGKDPTVVTRSKTTFNDPLKWKEPRHILVCSWSDFFIEEADKWREEAWEVMRRAPQHIYMLLTKRAELIWKGLPDDWEPAAYPNVWLGVSVEDQYRYNRIERVRRVPARVHFASCEPLLGRLPGMPLEHMEWVIVGGESGPHHRPMDPEWVREIRDQCVLSHVPFFFKQWSALRPGGDRLLDGKIWDQYPNCVPTLEIHP